MRIDVHAHYWAASYIDALAAAGRPDLGHARQSDDIDARIAEMDASGVDLQILSAIGLNVEVQDAAAAASCARHLNDLYVDLAARFPGRLQGFASVPLPHVAEAIAETDRALDGLGLYGVALPCIVGGKPIDHADYEPFWANLDAHGAVVYVHPAGGDSSCHPGLTDFHLNMALGSPLQIAMAPLRIGLSGLSTRHPNIRFVFAMCGGIFPFLWQRYERNLRRGIQNSALASNGPEFFAWMRAIPFDQHDPMSLFRGFWFDTSVPDIPSALRLSKETFGVDRLVLGSDAIFASIAETIEFIENSDDLTADEKAAILDTNALDLLEPVMQRASARAS